MRVRELINMGLHVFPLRPGTKLPYKGSWYDYTTCDADEAEGMEAGFVPKSSKDRDGNPVTQTFEGCNWAVNTGTSGLIVVDLDDKNGHEGSEEWDWLTAGRPEYGATMNVATPSGGRHIYFKGTAQNSASKIADGVDIRSVGGYVVAPGANVNGVRYHCTKRAPILDSPEWLTELCGAPRDKDKDANTPAIEELDTDNLTAAAIRILKDTEGAAKDSGTGNEDTFKLACRVKDVGISEGLCVELMVEHWADKCFPAFPADQLARLVANAYSYGSSAIGCATAEAAFNNYDMPLEYSYDFQARGSEVEAFKDWTFVDASDIVERDIPQREWIFGRRYIRKYVTQIVAPGGVGKSMLSIVDALSIAANESATGEEVIDPGPVWIHNAEDPLDELKMRVAAAMKFHGIRPDPKNLWLTSGRDIKLRIVHIIDNVAVFNMPMIEKVIRNIKEKGVVVFIGDPLIRLHSVRENSNEEMDVVMEALQYIAEETGCSIGIIHHTRKLNGSTGAGDMDAGRGASAVVSAARIQYTVTTMSEDEAKTFGVPEDRRRWYVQLKDGKTNMTPPVDKQVWLEKKSVHLDNGEAVGTFQPAELRAVVTEKKSSREGNTIIEILAGTFRDGTVHSVKECAKVVYADARWKKISDAQESTVVNKVSKLRGDHFNEAGTHIVKVVESPAELRGNAKIGVLVIRTSEEKR